MASNEIPDNVDALVSLAAAAVEGARTTGAAVGLAQNTESKIRADLNAFVGDPSGIPAVEGARNWYNAAKAAKTAATALRQSVDNTARAYCARAVGVLKNHLGTQWNAAWNAAGFTAGSLAIPDDCFSLLSEIRACLLAHPEYENAPLNFTVGDTMARMDEITAARAASNASVQALGEAKAAAATARRTLHRRLTGLRAELAQLLGPDDARWYAFGFDRPADGWAPGPVEHLILTPGAPGSLFADWDDARRATRYRVTKKVGDAAPEAAHADVVESECTLQGLPSGALVTITITAVNDAGDGPLAATATLTVP